MNIELFLDKNEKIYQKKLESWLFARNSYEEYYEQVEEEGELPDLYGKALLATEEQFPELINIVKRVSECLNMQMPKCFVYDSRLHTVDSEGISAPRLEISSRALENLAEKELMFAVSKELFHIKAGHIRYEVLSSKIENLFAALPNLPVVNLAKNFGGGQAADSAAFKFRNISFRWFESATYSAENFASCVVKDLRSVISSILMSILNNRSIVNKINVIEYVEQVESIDACVGPSALLEKINEPIPYGPNRILNIIRFLMSDVGKKMALEINI